MKTVPAYVVAIVASAVIAVPVSANILSNGDFNTGSLPDWWDYAAEPANQTVSIDNVYTYDSTPNALITSATATWRAAMGQNPSIGPNQDYSLSFVYSAVDTPTWGSAAVAINYYDAGAAYLDFEWIPLYDQQPGPNADGEWLTYSGNFTTPAGTASMQIEFDVWNWTSLHVDNVAVVIPEPATSALLGGAGILLLAWRRCRER